jgi:hypothetical protein
VVTQNDQQDLDADELAAEAVKTPKFRDALKILDSTVKETVNTFASIDQGDLPTLLRAYKELDFCEEMLALIHKQVTELHDKLRKETIPDIMETMGIDSVKLANRNFIVTTQTFASIPKDMQPKGFAWLRSVANIPELITETVNARSVSKFVKEYFEEHGKYPPEDCIKVYQQKVVQMRKV